MKLLSHCKRAHEKFIKIFEIYKKVFFKSLGYFYETALKGDVPFENDFKFPWLH